MTGQQRALRWLAAGVLVLWCGGFLRAENTEKSMVRALILTPPTVAVQRMRPGVASYRRQTRARRCRTPARWAPNSPL